MSNCKLCNSETKTVFNIDFRAVSICEDCATNIFLQQANWYARNELQKASNKEDVVVFEIKNRCDHKKVKRVNDIQIKGKTYRQVVCNSCGEYRYKINMEDYIPQLANEVIKIE